jgi:hypothetical protein
MALGVPSAWAQNSVIEKGVPGPFTTYIPVSCVSSAYCGCGMTLSLNDCTLGSTDRKLICEQQNYNHTERGLWSGQAPTPIPVTYQGRAQTSFT